MDFRKRKSRRSNFLVLIVLLAITATIASQLSSRQWVELYPYCIVEEDRAAVKLVLESGNIDYRNRKGRLVVGSEFRNQAQALLIQEDLPRGFWDGSVHGGLSDGRPRVTHIEQVRDMEKTICLLPGVQQAKFAIPDRTFFCDPDRPTTLRLLIDKRLGARTESGIERFLQMYGEPTENFRILYPDTTIGNQVSGSAASFTRAGPGETD